MVRAWTNLSLSSDAASGPAFEQLGRIVEQGTHDQLVANEGLYSRLLSYSDTSEESASSDTDT